MEGEGTKQAQCPTTPRGRWQNAYREFLRLRTFVVGATAVTLFVVALMILGPLGTLDTMPALRRLLYFGSAAFLMYPLCYSLAAVMLFLNRFASLPAIASASAGAMLLQVIACTAMVHTADTIFRPAQANPSLGTIFVTVLTVLAICSLFVHYVVFQQIATEHAHDDGNRSPEPAGDGSATDAAHAGGPEDKVSVSQEAHAEPPKTGQPTGQPQDTEPESPPIPDPGRFYARLPGSVNRDIIYLKVDDHYVEVHTTNGSCIVLARFADAIAELGDLGIQTHRSYWVARRHLIRMARSGAHVTVYVTGGHRVPVSRTYVPAVRDALRRSDGEEPRASAFGDGSG